METRKIILKGKQEAPIHTETYHKCTHAHHNFFHQATLGGVRTVSAFVTRIGVFRAVTGSTMHITLVACPTKGVREVQIHEEIEPRQL